MVYDLNKIKKDFPIEDHEYIPTKEEYEFLLPTWITLEEIIEWRKRATKLIIEMSKWISLEDLLDWEKE